MFETRNGVIAGIMQGTLTVTLMGSGGFDESHKLILDVTNTQRPTFHTAILEFLLTQELKGVQVHHFNWNGLSPTVKLNIVKQDGSKVREERPFAADWYILLKLEALW